jgi:hypothetical protein
VLIAAKMEPMSIPLDDGGSVSLTHTPWMDPSTLKEYGDISKIVFEPDAMYSVYYFGHHVITKYMIAHKIPVEAGGIQNVHAKGN